MNNNYSWKTEIVPPRRGINLNFKEIWGYKDLIFLFVKRDFVSKYKQTLLGPMWAIIQPILTTVVFSIVFGSLAKLTTSDVYNEEIQVPSFLFYMTGTIIWTYFSSTVTATSNTFITNRAVMGKVYYPRLVSPISTSLSNLISFFIQLLLFVIIEAVYIVNGQATVKLSLFVLLIPLLIVQLIMISSGIGIIVSSLTTKYRDLAMLVGFGLSLWQYLTPVAYGLALIPEKYLWIYMLNPLTAIVTTFRYALFGTGYFSIVYYLISLLSTVVLFFIGIVLFNKIERTFMDTV